MYVRIEAHNSVVSFPPVKMVNYKLTETSAIVIFVVSVLVGDSQGVQPHLGAQQVITRDLGSSELALSILVNQVSLLKLVNESSTICSLHEKELQENRDLKMELDVKTEGLKNELQDFLEAAVDKLENKTTATMTEIEEKHQQAREVLEGAKETAVNMSRQGERELQEMRHLRLQLDVKTEELNSVLVNMKNALQNKTAASLDEISRMTEEAAEDLRVKEAGLNASMQQGERELREMRELMNNLENFKTTTVEENQNMIAMINDIKANNEEGQRALNGLKETVADLSRQAARIPECEDGWSEYRWSCYKIFNIEVTYDEATRRCRAHNAHLASIGSEGENSFVAGMISGWTYIGLDDRDQEGVFTWQDGSPFGYSKWRSGEPDNLNGNQDCVNMYSDSGWADYPCTDREPYVCEKRL